MPPGRAGTERIQQGSGAISEWIKRNAAEEENDIALRLRGVHSSERQERHEKIDQETG